MKPVFSPILIGLLFLFKVVDVSAQQEADLVMYNGNIITVNQGDDVVKAVAVLDSVFIAVGSNQQIAPFIGPNTNVIDLDGLTVTPGLIDAHVHLMYYGMAENLYVNLRPPAVANIEDMLNKIAERVAIVDSGEWIVGDGFALFESDRMPTKWDLDQVSPDNPVITNSMGGHFGTANSYALNMAGITDTTPDPVGGIIEHDSITGEVNGVLWNHPAMDLVRIHMPPQSVEEMKEAAIYAQDYFLEHGITSFQDVNVRGLTRFYGYGQAASEESMKLRGYLLYTIEQPDDVQFCLDNTELYSHPMLAYPGNKFLLDGQPPTAYTHEYHPGISWNMSTWDEDSLKAAVKRLHREGRQLSFHVMGDAAIDLALDAIEEALQDTMIEDHRHRVEHVMIPTYEAIQRMANLGVVACLNLNSLYTSGDYFANYWPDQIDRLMPFRTMLDEGVKVALGSDFPTVLMLDPKLSLWASLARKSLLGNIMTFDQRVNIHEALYAHTMGSAYAAFQEDVKGSIEVGKYADMTVWDDDFYTVPISEMMGIDVVMTIVGGGIQHSTLAINESTGIDKSSSFELFPAAPNPFRYNTEIRFRVYETNTGEPVHLKVSAYNIMGEKIRQVAEGEFYPGEYSFSWDGTDESGNTLPSAVYFIKMTDAKDVALTKVVLAD